MLQETVIFRANDELAAAIQNMASKAGLNVSEYLREIIATSVGINEIVSPVCAKLAQGLFFTGELSAQHSAMTGARSYEDKSDADPISLLAAAGGGDTQAQRDLADMAIALALSGQPDVDPFLALSEGLVFARLADRHDETGDAMRIIRMLALASTLATGVAARDLAAEAIARLELAADGQSEHADFAADLLASSMATEHPETVRLSKDYRARLRDARLDRRTTE